MTGAGGMLGRDVAAAAEAAGHDVRTTKCRSLAAATARSPASFERPYAVCGATGSDSTYGVRLRPSKT